MAKAKALVVDDNPDHRTVLRVVLERAGFTVIEADDGIHGETACEIHKPDIVLMDIKMPGKDGIDSLAAIRQHSLEVPVIAVTTGAFPSDMERVRKADFADVITKPYGSEEILRAVDKFVPIRPAA